MEVEKVNNDNKIVAMITISLIMIRVPMKLVPRRMGAGRTLCPMAVHPPDQGQQVDGLRRHAHRLQPRRLGHRRPLCQEVGCEGHSDMPDSRLCEQINTNLHFRTYVSVSLYFYLRLSSFRL